MQVALWSVVAAIALTGAAVSPGWSADMNADEPIAFVTSERLHLPQVHLQLSQSEAAQLADVWLSQLDPADPRLAAGAVELLQDAPVEVLNAVVRRLSNTDLLARVLENAPLESVQELLIKIMKF